jgi:aminoglycoside 6'-N-acetyltransferase I
MRRIIDIQQTTEAQRRDAAHILVEALAHAPSAWSDLSSAMEEVASFTDDPERVALFGLEQDAVRGWIGAIRHSQAGWELHPLVVDPAHQRVGWGRRLVGALEDVARSDGAITLWLGTDDDFGGTNLYGENLYPDVLGKLRGLRATGGHPFTFYQRLGYSVTGIFPDVDGFGKHDILMAKRVASKL